MNCSKNLHLLLVFSLFAIVIFSIPVTYGNGVSCIYAMQEGQYAVFKVIDDDETEYRKYNITNIVENPNNYTITFDEFVATDPNQFPATPGDILDYTLTCNLLYDLFFDPTIISITLANNTVFTGQEATIEAALRVYVAQEAPEINVDSVTITFPNGPQSVRIEAKSTGITILSMVGQYATTGLLLYASYSMVDGSSGEIEIQKDITTMPGADQYTPAVIDELGDTDTPNLLLYLYIGIGVAIAAIVIGLGVHFVKKRKA